MIIDRRKITRRASQPIHKFANNFDLADSTNLADYVSANRTHVMTYEDFVRDEDEGLKGLMAQLYPDRPGGRVEILATRKPSDIVKRSNSQVKKMVARRADIKSPRRRRAIGANRSFRAGDERGRGRGLVRRVGRAGAFMEDVPRRRDDGLRPH